MTTDVAALLAAQSPSVQKEFDQGKDVGSIRTLQLERTPDSPFVKNLLAKNGMGDKDINRMQLIITYDQPEANPAWYQFLMGSSTQLSVVEFSELTKDAKDIKKEEDKASLAVIKAVPDSTNKMVVNGKDGYAMKPVSILHGLGRDRLLHHLHRVLCHWPRRVRLAGPVRTDARPHPFQRHGDCAADQPACFKGFCWTGLAAIPACSLRWAAYGAVLHYGDLLPA